MHAKFRKARRECIVALVIASLAMTPFVLIGVSGRYPNREWWYALYGVGLVASILVRIFPFYSRQDRRKPKTLPRDLISLPLQRT